MGSVWERIGWTDPERRDEALVRLSRKLSLVPAPIYVPPPSQRELDLEGHPVDCPLSPKELRATLSASHGMTDQMIADTWGVSIWTIKTQMRDAQAKLGAKNRCHLVAKAIREGLIT